jgi:23S rRNA (uracil1939-C5)-methyltransferase
LVYVSCNPATLARDLARLRNKFNIVVVQPFDMFPQTAEIETVAVLDSIRSR